MSDKAPKDHEQKDAEAEVEGFKQDLGPFVIAAETTRMAMVFTDACEADNPIIFALRDGASHNWPMSAMGRKRTLGFSA